MGVLAIAWWGPIAIVGGAVAGIAISYLLLVFLGAPPLSRRARRVRYEPTDRTNYPDLNPVAFIVAFALVGLVVGLSVGLSAG